VPILGKAWLNTLRINPGRVTFRGAATSSFHKACMVGGEGAAEQIRKTIGDRC